MNKELLNKFEKDGFVIIQNLIKKELLIKLENSLFNLIKYHLKEENVNLEQYQNQKELIHKGFIALDEMRMSDKKKTDRIQIIYNMIRRSEILSNIVHSDEVMNNVKYLLESPPNMPAYTFTQFCRMDSPKNHSFDLGWHQESYENIPGTRCVVLWAPAVDKNNIENGSMYVLKNSCEGGEQPHYIIQLSDRYINHCIPEDKIKNFSNYEKILLDLTPGDVLLFNHHLIHKTNTNRGNRVRFTISAHYINPFNENFKIFNEGDLQRHHESRCVNAKEYQDYVNAPKQHGGIKSY
jgi:ectoine hydroxylase-related dioxygenase (phytanoyl-CoA dioxygenase family)